jgi:hypothetical protein
MVSIYLIRPTICYEDGEIYVGSTKRKLNERFIDHCSAYKNNRTGYSCKILFEKFSIDFLEIIEIEKCAEIDKFQRERFWIEKLKCVNKNIPTQTSKEYRDKNKEKIAADKKEYRKINKDKLSKKFDCECGGKYTLEHKARHLKTKKHQDFFL